jgi:hypothetical protein
MMDLGSWLIVDVGFILEVMVGHDNGNSLGEATGRYVKYAIIVLVAALVFLLFFLVRDYRSLRRTQVIGARELFLSAIVKNHGHLTVNSVTMVRSWMTFDYINQLFGIPSDFLKAQMSIADSRYPKLTLSGYAKTEHVTSVTIVNEVEAAIQNYFATSPPATATSTST